MWDRRLPTAVQKHERIAVSLSTFWGTWGDRAEPTCQRAARVFDTRTQELERRQFATVDTDAKWPDHARHSFNTDVRSAVPATDDVYLRSTSVFASSATAGYADTGAVGVRGCCGCHRSSMTSWEFWDALWTVSWYFSSYVTWRIYTADDCGAHSYSQGLGCPSIQK